MEGQITHESLKPLINQLPAPMREKYFVWRRVASASARATRALTGERFEYFSPEFVAECVAKLLEMHKAVDQHVSMFSGDDPTPQPIKESDQ